MKLLTSILTGFFIFSSANASDLQEIYDHAGALAGKLVTLPSTLFSGQSTRGLLYEPCVGSERLRRELMYSDLDASKAVNIAVYRSARDDLDFQVLKIFSEDEPRNNYNCFRYTMTVLYPELLEISGVSEEKFILDGLGETPDHLIKLYFRPISGRGPNNRDLSVYRSKSKWLTSQGHYVPEGTLHIGTCQITRKGHIRIVGKGSASSKTVVSTPAFFAPESLGHTVEFYEPIFPLSFSEARTLF